MGINNFTHKIPAIISDVDGVVYRGCSAIGNSSKIIPAILNHRVDNKYKIPFICLTNGGGILEEERAELVNKKIGLTKTKLTGQNMILCHSPFRDEALVNKYRDKYVLVSGLGKVLDIAQKYGYKKAVDIEELFALYPQTCPSVESHYPKDKLQQMKQQVLDRFKTDEQNFKKQLQFDAVFLWSDAVILEMNLQLFSDLIISKDGRIGGKLRTLDDEQKVDFYISNPDVIYSDTFNIPRHGQGILLLALESVFKAQYHRDIKCIKYGKPELSTFDYTEKYVREQAEKQGTEISNFYMIGDNPDSDIEGAYRKGWESIVVKTGLYQDGHNHNAKYIVDDFEQAIKLISEKENLKIKW